MIAPRRLAMPTLLSLLLAGPAAAGFTDIGAGLTGVSTAGLAWGDYDHDGDLDLVIAGQTLAGPSARIYRNTGGIFEDATALPPADGLLTASVAWGDYDNDGDLDLAMTGAPVSTGVFSRIYRNDSGTFVDSGAPIIALRNSAVAWADYDNDGDLDLAISGNPGTGAPQARIYRNTAGVFEDASAGLSGVEYCDLAWADYDKDGDQDLVIAGSVAGSVSTTLYRNNGGVMIPVASSLPGIDHGAVAWCDFDDDGDFDLLLSGFPLQSRIFRNTSGNLFDTGFAMQGVWRGSAAWADIDNDGDGDLALCGNTGSTGFTAVYAKVSESMVDISAGLPAANSGDLAWGDFDHDGDADLALAGSILGQPSFARIYRNSSIIANTPPLPPSGLSLTADSVTVTFHWNAASDAQQVPAGLSYNVWAGSAPNTPDVMSPMAMLTTGVRLVPQLGNAGQHLSWSLKRSAFGGGQVHWGVQAIDQSFLGSAFSTGPSGTLGAGTPSGAPQLELRVLGPNPSRSEVRFTYSLPRNAHAELTVHDITGRRVGMLLDAGSTAGEHEAQWSGAYADGARCAPGVYFLRLSAGGVSTSTRVLRIE